MAGLRVLHVTDYASAYEGAFVRQLRMLDDELRGRGGRPGALCLPAAGLHRGWAQMLRDDGWSLHELPPGSTRADRGAVAAIMEAMRATDPDVVHVHFGHHDLSARRAVLRLRRAGGPGSAARLVWHYRTALEEPVEERGPLRRLKDHLKFARASRDVDLVVGVTRALAAEVVARGVRADAVRGIVAGCDTDTFRSDPAVRRRVREHLGLAERDVMLLHMGWSWHRKGGDLLAAAMRSLETRSGPRVVAYSIGAPEEALLGPVHRLPVTDRVHELHQASDIFVSASRSEGFGNGLVEAMACERVAVAATAAGQQETFAGLEGVPTVPVDDADALSSAIAALLSQRDRWALLGSANRQHVLERHSMRRWARQMADAYAELHPDRLQTAAARAAAAPGAEVA